MVFLFGTLLYVYGDLDNPDVGGALFFLYKDVAGIVLGMFLLFMLQRRPISILSFNWLIFFLILTLYTTVFLAIVDGAIGVSYLKLFKNGLLYVGFSILFLSCFLERYGITAFIDLVLKALFLAILLSLMLHWFSPIQSYTGRHFGTFGSPNSAGFAAGFAIALALTMRNILGVFRIREMALILSAIVMLVYTASIGAIVGLLLFGYIMIVVNSSSAVRVIWVTALLSLVVTAAAFLVYEYWSSYASIEIELLVRVAAIALEGLNNDSISIRLKDLFLSFSLACDEERSARYLFGCMPSGDFRRLDSVLFSMIFNFGFVFAFAYTVLLYFPVFMLTLNKSVGRIATRVRYHYSLVLFMLTFVPINLFLQHSFDIFPTNFMYAILLTLLYHVSSGGSVRVN